MQFGFGTAETVLNMRPPDSIVESTTATLIGSILGRLGVVGLYQFNVVNARRLMAEITIRLNQ